MANQLLLKQQSAVPRPRPSVPSTASVACTSRRTVAARAVEFDGAAVSRRSLLIASTLLVSSSRVANAEELGQGTSISSPAPSVSAAAPQVFQDDDYQLLAPESWQYIDIPIPRTERGPAPERSPLRVRFNSPDNEANLSVIVRPAQSLGAFSLLQVNDVSAFGPPEQAANLLLPRGAALLKAESTQVVLPPRSTPLGDVEIPPKSYYLYEFTSKGQRVFMSAAAGKGKVYVCGGSVAAAKWADYGSALQEAVSSFRLK